MVGRTGGGPLSGKEGGQVHRFGQVIATAVFKPGRELQEGVVDLARGDVARQDRFDATTGPPPAVKAMPSG